MRRIDGSNLNQATQADLLRRCPSCRKIFSLKCTRVEPDSLYVKIRYYRCSQCEREFGIVKRVPK